MKLTGQRCYLQEVQLPHRRPCIDRFAYIMRLLFIQITPMSLPASLVTNRNAQTGLEGRAAFLSILEATLTISCGPVKSALPRISPQLE